MIESQVRALFSAIASSEPGTSQVDTQLAHQRGRARLRWRRAGVAGAPVAAAVAVAAVVLAVGAAVPSGRTGPVSTGPSAPRQFNVLAPYLSFGWLPPGISTVEGGTSRQTVWVNAAQKLPAALDWSPATEWSVSVDAAGKCHLTGSPGGELTCSTLSQKGNPISITGRAPAVAGHRAYWGGSVQFGSPRDSSLYLVWQYSRNGWAEMTSPSLPNDRAKQAAAHRDAVKIARQIRYGAATPPLLFPVQLTHLPSRWAISSLTYAPYGKVLRAASFALGAGSPNLGADGGLQFETGLPYFTIEPATGLTNPCGHRTSKTINGYRVVLTNEHGTRSEHDLCAGDADGWSLGITEFGSHPPISVAGVFAHMRVLGRNPANWTGNPLG
jgi:hypothetical protein